MELKTYNISDDILSGLLDIDRIREELEDSNSINNFEGPVRVGESIKIYGESFLDETACDAIVTNHSGIPYTEIISPSNITANVENWNPDGFKFASTILLTSNSNNKRIRGLAPGYDKEEKLLVNTGTKKIILDHNDATSLAGYRILCGNNKDISVPKNGVVGIKYIESNWRVITKSW